jgi:hypothetical protein
MSVTLTLTAADGSTTQIVLLSPSVGPFKLKTFITPSKIIKDAVTGQVRVQMARIIFRA